MPSPCAHATPCDAVEVHAPAKINRTLRIFGRRDDGFHELESEFVAVSLFDTLRVERLPPGDGERVTLEVDGPTAAGVPADDSNLVAKAVAEVCRRTDATDRFRVRLRKRIPNQAGLGGGSSDAAAALWAANRLLGSPLPHATLHAIAASLGSDLNFFLAGTPRAMCRGRGERVERLPPRPLFATIAKPSLGLSTGAIFAAYHDPDVTPAGRNDLQAAAEHVSPPLRDWRRTLEAATAPSQTPSAQWTMSGSGSAYVCEAATHAAASRLTARLRGRGFDAWTVSAAVAQVGVIADGVSAAEHA